MDTLQLHSAVLHSFWSYWRPAFLATVCSGHFVIAPGSWSLPVESCVYKKKGKSCHTSCPSTIITSCIYIKKYLYVCHCWEGSNNTNHLRWPEWVRKGESQQWGACHAHCEGNSQLYIMGKALFLNVFKKCSGCQLSAPKAVDTSSTVLSSLYKCMCIYIYIHIRIYVYIIYIYIYIYVVAGKGSTITQITTASPRGSDKNKFQQSRLGRTNCVKKTDISILWENKNICQRFSKDTMVVTWRRMLLTHLLYKSLIGTYPFVGNHLLAARR